MTIQRTRYSTLATNILHKKIQKYVETVLIFFTKWYENELSKMSNQERSLISHFLKFIQDSFAFRFRVSRYTDFFFFYIPFIDSPFLSSYACIRLVRNKEPIHATSHDRYTGTRQLPGSFHRNLLQIMQFPTVTDWRLQFPRASYRWERYKYSLCDDIRLNYDP